MSCGSHCQAVADQFDAAVAQRDLARYRRHGPDRTTHLLLDAIRQSGVEHARLLDIGAGIGVLHHELLGGVVDHATHVEAAPAYVGAAREEDARRGHADRVTYVQGDAVALGADLPLADLVTLDRVICCYPDWEGLARLAAAKTGRLLGVSLPKDRWYVRALVALGNLVRAVRGNAFRAFVHPIASMDALLEGLGFRPVGITGTLAWRVVLYRRQNTT